MYIKPLGAVRPWDSVDAIVLFSYKLPPQCEIDICLNCPLKRECCEVCDGKRNLSKKVGRVKVTVNMGLLRKLCEERRGDKEICARLGISKRTFYNRKKLLKEAAAN